ncbi:hypothetical protein FM106_30810 [Brachybacterium faecium]|nr:hypothetical protein FM106_30810 [Brachybacterium faecium]
MCASGERTPQAAVHVHGICRGTAGMSLLRIGELAIGLDDHGASPGEDGRAGWPDVTSGFAS